MIRAALSIAGKDLRQRFRDRSALVLGFAAPLLVATLMNLAFRGTEEFHATLGVADDDGGEVAGHLLEVLRSPELADVITVEDLAGAAAARAAVDGADVDAAIVSPAGFSAAVASAGPARLEVLTSVDRLLAGEVAQSLASTFASQVSAVRLSVAAAVAGGAGPEEVQRIVAESTSAVPPEVAVERPSGDRQLQGVAYYGPAMAMFFVLFAVGFTARSFFLERREGTLDRMAAAPLRPWAILAGKAMSVFVYALASLLTMSLAGAVVFGASWGSPLAVVALCVVMAAVVVSLAALVMSVARTERQAETISSALTFSLAVLGGNFVFLGAAPEVLRRIAGFTPNGLALQAFTDLGTGTPAGDAVAGPLVGMAAIAAAVTAVAAWAGRRAVVQ